MTNTSAITLFRETKTAQEWTQDPRCCVGRNTFYHRLKSGWEPLDALTTPPRGLPARPTETTIKERAASRQAELTLYGETKTLSQWAQDARCEVSLNVLRTRIGRGWTVEDALRAAPRPTARQKRPNAPLYEAFGESKRLREWAKDARCEVAVMTLWRRLSAGLPLEQALKARR